MSMFKSALMAGVIALGATSAQAAVVFSDNFTSPALTTGQFTTSVPGWSTLPANQPYGLFAPGPGGRDDRLLREQPLGAVEEVRESQRVVLHQALHATASSR